MEQLRKEKEIEQARKDYVKALLTLRKTIESILSEEDSKRYRNNAIIEIWSSIIEEDKANIVPVNKAYIKIRENKYFDLELTEII